LECDGDVMKFYEKFFLLFFSILLSVECFESYFELFRLQGAEAALTVGNIDDCVKNLIKSAAKQNVATKTVCDAKISTGWNSSKKIREVLSSTSSTDKANLAQAFVAKFEAKMNDLKEEDIPNVLIDNVVSWFVPQPDDPAAEGSDAKLLLDFAQSTTVKLVAKILKPHVEDRADEFNNVEATVFLSDWARGLIFQQNLHGADGLFVKTSEMVKGLTRQEATGFKGFFRNLWHKMSRPSLEGSEIFTAECALAFLNNLFIDLQPGMRAVFGRWVDDVAALSQKRAKLVLQCDKIREKYNDLKGKVSEKGGAVVDFETVVAEGHKRLSNLVNKDSSDAEWIQKVQKAVSGDTLVAAGDAAVVNYSADGALSVSNVASQASLDDAKQQKIAAEGSLTTTQQEKNLELEQLKAKIKSLSSEILVIDAELAKLTELKTNVDKLPEEASRLKVLPEGVLKIPVLAGAVLSKRTDVTIPEKASVNWLLIAADQWIEPLQRELAAYDSAVASKQGFVEASGFVLGQISGVEFPGDIDDELFRSQHWQQFQNLYTAVTDAKTGIKNAEEAVVLATAAVKTISDKIVVDEDALRKFHDENTYIPDGTKSYVFNSQELELKHTEMKNALEALRDEESSVQGDLIRKMAAVEDAKRGKAEVIRTLKTSLDQFIATQKADFVGGNDVEKSIKKFQDFKSLQKDFAGLSEFFNLARDLAEIKVSPVKVATAAESVADPDETAEPVEGDQPATETSPVAPSSSVGAEGGVNDATKKAAERLKTLKKSGEALSEGLKLKRQDQPSSQIEFLKVRVDFAAKAVLGASTFLFGDTAEVVPVGQTTISAMPKSGIVPQALWAQDFLERINGALEGGQGVQSLDFAGGQLEVDIGVRPGDLESSLKNFAKLVNDFSEKKRELEELQATGPAQGGVVDAAAAASINAETQLKISSILENFKMEHMANSFGVHEIRHQIEETLKPEQATLVAATPAVATEPTGREFADSDEEKGVGRKGVQEKRQPSKWSPGKGDPTSPITAEPATFEESPELETLEEIVSRAKGESDILKRLNEMRVAELFSGDGGALSTEALTTFLNAESRYQVGPKYEFLQNFSGEVFEFAKAIYGDDGKEWSEKIKLEVVVSPKGGEKELTIGIPAPPSGLKHLKKWAEDIVVLVSTVVKGGGFAGDDRFEVKGAVDAGIKGIGVKVVLEKIKRKIPSEDSQNSAEVTALATALTSLIEKTVGLFDVSLSDLQQQLVAKKTEIETKKNEQRDAAAAKVAAEEEKRRKLEEIKTQQAGLDELKRQAVDLGVLAAGPVEQSREKSKEGKKRDEYAVVLNFKDKLPDVFGGVKAVTADDIFNAMFPAVPVAAAAPAREKGEPEKGDPTTEQREEMVPDKDSGGWSPPTKR
jgi:hypothetical protein